jgi:hypothetical protein
MKGGDSGRNGSDLDKGNIIKPKGGDSGRNGSDLDKGNIIKPTFDTLMEEGRKPFKAYRTNLVELFLSCCEASMMTWTYWTTTRLC